MKNRTYFLGLACLVLAACGTKEELPPERTSVGLTMDGSRRIPLTGAVNQVTQTNALADRLSPEGWATGPVPLPKPLGFAIAGRSGSVFVYDENDSLKHRVNLGDSILIDQLIGVGLKLYAIGLHGNVYCFEPSGKILWSNKTSAGVTANVLLAEGKLLIPCGHDLFSFDANSGQPGALTSFTYEIHSLAFSKAKNAIVAALTQNLSGTEDSLIVLNMQGGREHGYALKETRFTSNIAIAGEDGELVAYGYLGGMNGPQRTSAVALVAGAIDGKLTTTWTHAVPYVIGNVAANHTDVIVGGIREQGGELVSGIDAFRLEDTITAWSRRFTEPLVAPFAVSDGDIYLHLSFESDAVVETRGIFYTLDAETGKTLREQGIPGAVTGFLPHIPMPDYKGRFLLADRTRLLVYLLDRSSFERVFK